MCRCGSSGPGRKWDCRKVKGRRIILSKQSKLNVRDDKGSEILICC